MGIGDFPVPIVPVTVPLTTVSDFCGKYFWRGGFKSLVHNEMKYAYPDV
jgi:hypothetical protein